jgi:ABC-2 type transport system permease protein
MSIHRHGYRPYSGPRTSTRARFLVPARFALLELFTSRMLVSFLVLSVVPFLVAAALIYVSHSPASRALLGAMPALDIGRAFFLSSLTLHGFLAFVLAAWVGPGLVAPDLANGALPLFLSRPLSRAEYVLGKMAVLLGLLSLVTWIPNLILFVLQASLEDGWFAANRRVAAGILLGSWIWIAVLSLLALALSAWVRRRAAGGLLMFAVFFVGQGVGEIWRTVLENPWGRVFNLLHMIRLVWHDLFGMPPPPVFRGTSSRGVSLDAGELPVAAAWISLLAVCALCLWLLDRRVRAKEVVR